MQHQPVRPIIALLACAFGLLTISVRHVFADAAALEQVTEIFGAVSGPIGNTSSTESAYTRLQKVKPSETAPAPVRYAYLLGLLELHKQRDALIYAGELVQHDSHVVRFRLLRARLLLREKKFPEAFVDLEAAGRLLAVRTKKETLDG